MADKLSQILLEAIGRAALAPAGRPLIGAKAIPGLFPATAPARQAAQRACADGLLRLVSRDPNGKAERDLYTAGDAGLAYLLRHNSPKQVLGDLARAIESRHGQIENLLNVTQEARAELVAIKCILEKLVDRESSAAGAPIEDKTPIADASAAIHWLIDLRTYLFDWDTGGAAGDYPLPELFARLQSAHPALTIGRFHDGLRELHDREQVHLHPWTGPLYELPEPAFALLIGHEIAYYASLRVSAALKEFATQGVLV